MPQQRRLIIIPIVHTRADFGSLGSKVPADQQYETMATQYWRAGSEYVQKLPGDFSKLKVYQDGLPNVPPELVTYVIDRAKPVNYDILRWLRKQGRILSVQKIQNY